ncbi:MAG: DUF2087 domain-containing protein [Tabrizicola sp.]|nr:DUF2087 domain-containing protein [Tabrizicola sp.]
MTRPTLSLPVADLSVFARSLRRDLQNSPEAPGHLALMNMLARAAGFGNLQHLRANQKAAMRSDPPAPVVDHTKVQKLLRYFDREGRLVSWPSRTSVQLLAVWLLWSHLPRGEIMTERQISARLNDWHLFGDAAIIRRTMAQSGLVTRNVDATEYRRVERQPPPEAIAAIRSLKSARER